MQKQDKTWLKNQDKAEYLFLISMVKLLSVLTKKQSWKLSISKNKFFMKDVYTESLVLHKKLRGKIELKTKKALTSRKDLSLLYTPGVAQPCREIAKKPSVVYDYTWKSNTIAIISDGSAVLGLGNIGAEASLPVLEGKSLLFKELANINCIPIALSTQKSDEIITIIKNIMPSFGAICLEDIAAPRCFQIEEKLQGLSIPVVHDDQHGTAIRSEE